MALGQEREELARIGQAIRAARRRQKRTLTDIARETGLTVSLLSQVERGKTVPSLASLRLMARALNISMFSLLSYLEGESRVVRRGQRKTFQKPGYSATFELLAPHLSGYMEPVMVYLDPGASTCEEPMSHPCDEWFIVLEGTVDADLNGLHYRLEAGDSLYIDASSTPHRYTNAGTTRAVAICVMSPPSW